MRHYCCIRQTKKTVQKKGSYGRIVFRHMDAIRTRIILVNKDESDIILVITHTDNSGK